MPAELPITGYLDRFSRRPGGRFAVQVSVPGGGECRAQLQRILGGDPNPQGPGLRFEDLSHRFDHGFAGRHQPIRQGSHGIVPAGPVRDAHAPCTWTVLAWAATLGEPCAVLAEESAGCSVQLLLGADGARAEVEWPGGRLEVATGARLPLRQWHRLWVSVDPVAGQVLVGQQALGGQAVTKAARVNGIGLPSGGPVLIAAADAESPARHFTGKLEDPAILAGIHAEWPGTPPLPDALPGLLAAWDFAQNIEGTALRDVGPSGLHGTLVNLPARAVVGARWTGQEMAWRHAPRDYGAIHFHVDDLEDCGWETDFAFTVPEDLDSGLYALHLTCAAGEDWLPFYVLPKREGPHAPVCFLASTFTYQAYFNHARGNADAAFKARVKNWGAFPYNADDFPIYGRSTYNMHEDGSGIAYSSRRRPTLTMRPGYLTFDDPKGSGLRHFPADTHLLGWLAAKEFAFDIVTDEDLDEEGAALLAPYRTVLTGSHPEYHTPGTLDALHAYTREHGGKLVYLGGNGFYWRIARSPALPHVIEIRRAEGGIRAWAAEPGEYYHSFDGQLGGLWRRNRRPPQALVGVGFSGQGLFEGTYYRRLPASYAPEHAWVFEGVEAEILGDYGLSGGGAAGFELDRADVALGTPENAVILARSEDPPDSFMLVPEERLTNWRTIPDEEPDALMRGEIVYFELPGGGAVFSVGSITFCGSLWQDGAFGGPVSRMLENVVRRFSA